MVAHACSPSTRKAKVGSGVQGHPILRGEFEASLGRTTACLMIKVVASAFGTANTSSFAWIYLAPILVNCSQQVECSTVNPCFYEQQVRGLASKGLISPAKSFRTCLCLWQTPSDRHKLLCFSFYWMERTIQATSLALLLWGHTGHSLQSSSLLRAKPWRWNVHWSSDLHCPPKRDYSSFPFSLAVHCSV